MSEFSQTQDSSKPQHKIIHETTALVAVVSATIVGLLLPDMSVGNSIWLRAIFGVICTAIAFAIAYGVSKLLQVLPIMLSSAFIGSCALLTWCINDVLSAFIIMPYSTSWQITMATSFLISLSVVIVTMLVGAAIMARPKIVGVIIVVVLSFSGLSLWLTKPGVKKDIAAEIDALLKAPSLIEAPNPVTQGVFKVETLYYGSGRDKHRPEYAEEADIITDSVDASPFVPEGWSVARTSYWGFDQTQLPINGRVWFPTGEGPFPLVLIVHGTTLMTEFSTAGFSYLGELLASRGYIVASVDENFLNYGWYRYGDFTGSDIDARGWLILQHLRVWRDWNKDAANVFYGKVDMRRIALIGHSRGGEAIAAATAFNRMKRYPGNSNITFNFHFNIRSLIAFAPSDIYQKPYERTTPTAITDVNYLLLLGTHDRQVPTILGSRVYQRVSFGDESESNHGSANDMHRESYFKSALYISRANHSQFNSDWGIYDFPWPYRLLSDTGAHLSGEEQRYIAKLYTSAFLDATIRDDKRYIPLFRDYHLIESWLPKTAYISRYQDSSFQAIADFDEDLDPETTTIPGGTVVGKNLERWHEEDIDYHYFLPFGSRSNRVVSVGWQANEKTAPMLGFELPTMRTRTMKMKPKTWLMFSILCPDQTTLPEVSIQLSDTHGRVARLPLKSIFTLQRPLHVTLTRLSLLEQPSPVIVLQTVSIPLSLFSVRQPKLELANLREIDFLFEGENAGTVMLDDIGFD